MVTTTAPDSTKPRSHRISPAVTDRIKGYRWPIAAVLMALVTLTMWVAWSSALGAFETGALAAIALTGWRNTKDAREDAREWAKLRAEYDKKEATS